MSSQNYEESGCGIVLDLSIIMYRSLVSYPKRSELDRKKVTIEDPSPLLQTMTRLLTSIPKCSGHQLHVIACLLIFN